MTLTVMMLLTVCINFLYKNDVIRYVMVVAYAILTIIIAVRNKNMLIMIFKKVIKRG